MRHLFLLTLVLISDTIFSQIADPIPDPINYSGLVVKLDELAVIPASSPNKPFTRINLLREAPDGSGRLFVNDLRGKFWALENGEVTLFADLERDYPRFIDSPGRGTGFGAFAFHPEFATNGLFYTTHTEATGSGIADYTPLFFTEITMQWILTEWRMSDPASTTFAGSKREILRFDFPGNFHGMQEVAFNPNASTGDPDYGLLYICLGDGTSALNLLENNLQTTESFLGTIFRIDPLGNDGPNGNYGIPGSNPFSDDTSPKTLNEIYALGFRNPHRISWDRGGDHKMLEGDIGEKNIEEVNLILPGHNYGWSEREGTFLIDMNSGRENVRRLPADDSLRSYTYPVAQYDHDEGLAIVGGYVYRGGNFPELYGQYIFGDIVSGLLFHVPVEELEIGRQAEIFKVATLGSDGFGTSLLAEVNHDRVDLRFGVDEAGEIYLLSKADGKIRRLVHPDAVSSLSPEGFQTADWLSPNPANGILFLSNSNQEVTDSKVRIINAGGVKVFEKMNLRKGESIDLSRLPKGIYWASFSTKNKRKYIQKIVLR